MLKLSLQYAYSCAETMSFNDYITLVDGYGLGFTPEAKTPEIDMPFQGDYTQHDFIQQIIDTLVDAGITPDRVWLQSFLPNDIFYWIKNEPDFGAQAVYLDERADLTKNGYAEAVASLPDLKARGVNIVAPSIWQLVTIDNATKSIVPSTYMTTAQEVGLDVIAWSFDRSGPLEVDGGGYYYESVTKLINNDGDEYTVLDVIAQYALGVFSDWPATVTYYANCMGL